MRQFTPWDQGGVPIELQRFVDQSSTPRATLIPGCGVGHEVRYLAQANWPVVAIDFSPVAIAAAQSALGTYANRVVQADFFAFAPPSPVEFIYERAFLCALPRQRWPQVITRWADLLSEGGLLGGFFFFDTVLAGPPFGANRSELASMMQPYFELLEDQPAQHSIAVFAGREQWQLWRRKTHTTP